MSLIAALALQGCGGDDYPKESPYAGQGPVNSVQQNITAAAGGTLSLSGNQIVVTIPAGALSGDTTVSLDAIDGTASPALPANMIGVAVSYRVTFSGGATLANGPMYLKVQSAAPPVHPQIRQAVMLNNNAWQLIPATFDRTSDNTTVVRATAPGTYRIVYRTLQRANSDGVARGRDVFMYETFGSEGFFGAIGLHTVLNGVKPVDAVALGVQIDVTKVPAPVVALLTGTDNAAKVTALNDPATTRLLIKSGAVIGVKGVFDPNDATNTMTAAGITCALCHVTVTPMSFNLGAGPTPLPIGMPRFDGVPNLAMDAGKILSFTPAVQGIPGASAALAAWGPNNFDIRALPDNPLEDGVNNPTQVPPLWNFIDLEQQDYCYDWDCLFRAPAGMRGTAMDNSLASQAEAVYDLVQHSNGAFALPNGSLPPVLSITPPQALVDALVAAEMGAPGNDILPAQKLLDVQEFQRSIVSPAPGAFDEALAQQGFELFWGSKARCGNCHRSAEFTGPVMRAITNPSPLPSIKTPGLRGIAFTPPYFANGSAPTLKAAVKVYVDNGIVGALTDAEQTAIAEYMKSL